MTSRFSCLHLQGGLLAPNLVDQIADGSAPGQKPSDFGLDTRRHITDDIAAAWTDARAYWSIFQHRLERLSPSDTGTSATRDQWMIPFLSILGYELIYTPRAAEAGGQTYALSHRAGTSDESPPIHVVGCNQSIDRRPESGRPRLAPHSLLQEYLNRTEHLWGLVTNGYLLRVLRNSQLMRRQAYIEFDLMQMMEAERFADFGLLYRLIHRTRLPPTIEDAPECLLERYYSLTVEQGGRVRDHLRDGVEEALKIFANGFLSHSRNNNLHEAVGNGQIKPLGLYQQLLRLIYRLLFLMVAEERNLVTENQIYREHYSISRLRLLAEQRAAYSDHEDLWLSLQTTFRLLQDEKLGETLQAPPLNGDLFNPVRTSHLNSLFLQNRELLKALWHLSMYRENDRMPWRRINYAALDVEELGSVYESLLDFTPFFITQNGRPAFDLGYGTERKSTGSYYTPPELVNELIKSALVPVMEDRLKAAKIKEEKEKAILSLKVCDPASGSGHFLLAASRKLGMELAKIRTGDDEPAPEQVRLAIRNCITHCIYGVDKNPLAVDLCKVALWIEGHTKGKPLTFLDHRIRCGDSLIGVMDLNVLKEGIPDDAFKPVLGDDKEVARALKKRNRDERLSGQWRLPFKASDEIHELTQDRRLLKELSDDSPEQIQRKAEAYRKSQSQGTKWWQDNTACHLWTAAFFAELTEENARNCQIPTTDTLHRYLETHSIDGRYIGTAWAIAQHHHFFHWPLEFPEVFANKGEGGFDCVLGNPPWDMVELSEKEFFAQRAPEIAKASSARQRQKMIADLLICDPRLYGEYSKKKRKIYAFRHSVQFSGRFQLSSKGRINLYPLFVEATMNIMNPFGFTGLVVPSAISMDAYNVPLFSELCINERLCSLLDFENRKKLFPVVDSRFRFSLLTFGGISHRSKHFSFVFLAQDPMEVSDNNRRYEITSEELKLYSPNTLTPPIFSSTRDSEIANNIYSAHGVFIKKRIPSQNLWKARIQRMLSLSDPGDLFRKANEMTAEDDKCDKWVRIYAGKAINHFNHRYSFYRGNKWELANEEKLADPYFEISTEYFVRLPELNSRLLKKNPNNWLLGYRDITNATNERTSIAAIIPRTGCDTTCRNIFSEIFPVSLMAGLLANLNAYAFDYLTRQKVIGTHLSAGVLEQIPVLPPHCYATDCIWNKAQDVFSWIWDRTLELTFTAWDLEPFAKDSGYDGPPFVYDDNRRFLLRCELDAAYFHLYRIHRNDMEYIMDTFPIVKRKDEQKYDEYRTKRVILECYDAMAEAIKTGQPYKTILDPLPGPPMDAQGNFLFMYQWDRDNWPVHIHPPHPEWEESLLSAWFAVYQKRWKYLEDDQVFPWDGRETFTFALIAYLVQEKPKEKFEFYRDAALLASRPNLCEALLLSTELRTEYLQAMEGLAWLKFPEVCRIRPEMVRKALQSKQLILTDAESGATMVHRAAKLPPLPRELKPILPLILKATENLDKLQRHALEEAEAASITITAVEIDNEMKGLMIA